MNVAIIGCGGTGGWFAAALGKMLGEQDTIVLIDKDVFEKKNLDRQLMCKIGDLKTVAVAASLVTRAKVHTVHEWYTADTEFPVEVDYLVCCADNHPCRAACLRACDQGKVERVFIAGNGYWNAEAYTYSAAMAETPLDPREYYPELLTSHTGDPLSPSCTGAILESEPQLALANMQAAAFALQLLWFWAVKVPEFDLTDNELRGSLPVHIEQRAGLVKTWRVKDKEKS